VVCVAPPPLQLTYLQYFLHNILYYAKKDELSPTDIYQPKFPKKRRGFKGEPVVPPYR
jgi:hypothetical protein